MHAWWRVGGVAPPAACKLPTTPLCPAACKIPVPVCLAACKLLKKTLAVSMCSDDNPALCTSCTNDTLSPHPDTGIW